MQSDAANAMPLIWALCGINMNREKWGMIASTKEDYSQTK
jgi:hypothetical protein